MVLYLFVDYCPIVASSHYLPNNGFVSQTRMNLSRLIAGRQCFLAVLVNVAVHYISRKKNQPKNANLQQTEGKKQHSSSITEWKFIRWGRDNQGS